MKKLIIIIFMLIGWMSGYGQDHSDYIYNFRLPGTSGANFDFSPLDDSVSVAKNQGWNILIMGYYNISHYNSASEYKPIVERFEKKDSSIIISFFKEGGGFDFDIKVQSGDPGLDENIASEIHNYLVNNHTGYDGQIIINEIAKSLSFSKAENLSEYLTENCSIGRSSQAIINSKFITSEDAFFISHSGIPILIPAGSKVDFYNCNVGKEQCSEAPSNYKNAKGVLKSFEHNGKLYSGMASVVNGTWEFSGYKYTTLNNNGETIHNSYYPFRTFSNGGSIFLVFVTDCEKLQIKEFEHINSLTTSAKNKHAGPFVDVKSIYPNFVKEYRLQVGPDGNFKKVSYTPLVSEIEVTLNCPPPQVLDAIKLNKAISGATYVENLYDNNVTLVHTSLGKIAVYDIENSPKPTYMIYDEVNGEWDLLEVDEAVFTNQLRGLFTSGAKLGAKVAIFSATFAGSGGGVGIALAVDVFAAGAMYAIDGDSENLAMDLLLVPLGAAGEILTVAKDISKVADAMKDASKFDDVTSAAYKGYRSSKGIKATKNFKIKNLDGTWLDWASIKPDIENIVGADYAKFCDDFVEIAKNSGKHLELLSCSIIPGVRDNGYGTRSGCHYPLVAVWKKLASLNTESKIWLRSNYKLIKKMAGKPADYQDKIVNYYKRHNSNADIKTYPGPSSSGQYYDEFGHPVFTNDVPLATNGKRAIYKPVEGLDGPGTSDFTKANNWALKPVNEGGGGFDLSNFEKNGTGCRIKDPNSPYKDSEGWVTCTWHHHEDGKTLMPVPTVVHNRTNASHIGGVQAINEGIVGFFDSPTF